METVPTVRPPLSLRHSTSSLDRRDSALQDGTLCATSTVGVAALGYSFGREAQPATPRPGSNKRKAGGETFFAENIQPTNTITTTNVTSLQDSLPSTFPNDSSTPSPSSQPLPRVQTTASQTSLYAAEPQSIGENEEHVQSSYQGLGPHPAIRERPTSLEHRGNGTNRSSSWMKRLSTLSSSSHNESASPSSRSGSPSMSFSNGSSAPILPHVNSSPAVLPPNKLVKRTSSQRALHGTATSQQPSSRPQFPTLRRPATSHQRSATLRQQNPQGFETEPPASARQLFAVPSLPIGRSTPRSANIGHWQPHFRRKPKNPSAEGPPAKRNTAGGTYQNETIRRITPDVDQLPTLLMATSISPKVSEEAASNDHNNNPLTGSGTNTPSGIRSSFASSTDASDSDRPRRSFSIGDMLSSRTPYSWKGAQSSSHLKKAHRSNGSTGRRVASAPQTSKLRRTTLSNKADVGYSPGRRNMTDPSILHHVSSEMGTTDSPVLHSSGLHGAPVLPSPLYSPNAFQIDFRNGVSSHPSTSHSESPSTGSYVTSAPPSSPPVPILAMNRPQRYSVGPSDRASTLVGSDNDARGFIDEEEMDFQSETVFDSLRTGATGSSNSGTRGPRIETIFDGSPPDIRKPKLVELQELLRDGSFSSAQANTGSKRRLIEGEEGLSTPIRASASKQEDDDFPTPVNRQVDRLLHPVVAASPAEVPSSLSLGQLEWDDDDVGRSTGRWAFEGEEGEDWDCDDGDFASHDQTGGPSIPLGHSRVIVQPNPAVTGRDPLAYTDGSGKRDSRNNIFDWSEQHYVEKDALQGSSPRPSTVHGKQGAESRSSRPTGRRGPHAVHLRSQSVPVTPDASIHRDHGTSSSKLGPWGLGNKGVSEDWNDDFEFEEPNVRGGQGDGGRDLDSTSRTIPDFVPKAILERQASVHGQFGQVREFALMVEELKRLRAQASSLGIIEGPSVELWKEAEGIINLATQDDDEREYSPPHSPSSPRSNPDPFEEESVTNQNRRISLHSPTQEQIMVKRDSHDFGSTIPSLEAISRFTTPPPMRTRKESSAKAKSVLETIYQQRGNNDPLLTDTESRTQKKLPFDTTSLRDLVVRAGVVTRAVKEIVRKAENTPQAQVRQSSPPPDPLFSQIFVQPDESPLTAKGRVSKNTSSNGFRPGAISGNENEINGHMKMMTVV